MWEAVLGQTEGCVETLGFGWAWETLVANFGVGRVGEQSGSGRITGVRDETCLWMPDPSAFISSNYRGASLCCSASCEEAHGRKRGSGRPQPRIKLPKGPAKKMLRAVGPI